MAAVRWSGRTVLVRIHRRTGPGALRVVATGRPVLRILHLTGLTATLDIYPSYVAAVSGS